jgi:hypothetical protein
LPSSSTSSPSTSSKSHADRMRSSVSSFQHRKANSAASAFVPFGISDWVNTRAHLARFRLQSPVHQSVQWLLNPGRTLGNLENLDPETGRLSC